MTDLMVNWLNADWPTPSNIIAGVTTRKGGVSEGVYSTNNLALHVGDNTLSVKKNRIALDKSLSGEKHWQWLDQVHGNSVVEALSLSMTTSLRAISIPQADACYTQQSNTVCTVLTADCLPILICNKQGSEVAAVHAGWRSLCNGVIENTIAAMQSAAEDLLVWFGPAIGANQFEVGEDVRQAFMQANCGALSEVVFKPIEEKPGKYLSDIYQLATIRLQALDVSAIYGGQYCTVSDKHSFYSYRRDGETGRMASFIYINK